MIPHGTARERDANVAGYAAHAASHLKTVLVRAEKARMYLAIVDPAKAVELANHITALNLSRNFFLQLASEHNIDARFALREAAEETRA